MSRKKKAAVITILVLLAAAAALWLALPGIVRAKAEKAAAERGFRIEIGDLELGLGKIVMRDVRVTPERVPVDPFTVRTVTVLTSWLDVTEVRADGMEIRIRGDAREVAGALKGGGGGPGSGTRKKLVVTGVSVEWPGPCGGEGRATVAGVSVTDKVRADSATAECYGATMRADGLSLEGRDILADAVRAEYHGFEMTADLVRASAEGELELSAGRVRAERGDLKATVAGMRATASRNSVSFEAKSTSLSAEGLEEDLRIEGVRTSLELGRGERESLKVRATAESVDGGYRSVTGGPVKARGVSASGSLSWGPGWTRPWRADGWEMKVGETSIVMSGVLEDGSWEASLGLSSESGCGGVLRSIPEGMAPRLEGFEAEGPVKLTLEVVRRKDVTVKAVVKNGCKFTSWPEGMSRKALRGKFSRQVYGAGGELKEADTGPGSTGWTPYGRISKFLIASVQMTEDPGFFRNRGFDVQAIENSIKANIESGRFTRGASTVTMQLAKNLWLTRSKTVARKIQEAFLTTYLEQVLTKEEILETYFNVVEFGPSLYGVGPAAAKFFRSSPEDLTLGQSLFLTSVLPSPKTIWFGPDGRLSTSRVKWMHVVMESMQKRGLITEEELAEGLAEEVILGGHAPGVEDVGPTGPVKMSPGGLSPDWSQ